MTIARVLRDNGAHVEVGFYTGPDAGHLAHNGVLVFTREEWLRDVQPRLLEAGFLDQEARP